MRNFKILPLIILLMLSLVTHGQPVFPINTHAGQVVYTCSGRFTDSSGDFSGLYGPDEDFSVTFCSNDSHASVLEMHFGLFELGAGDYLFVYDGNNASAPLLMQATGSQLRDMRFYSSGGCLHFRFVSSPTLQARGWDATINCLSICETFRVRINPQPGTFLFCPGTQQVTFDAVSSYLPQNTGFNPAQVSYNWQIGAFNFTGPTITHQFQASGAFPVTVTATDATTGCIARNTEIVKIGTIPAFTGTIASVDTVCSDEPFSLKGVASPTLWTGFQIAVSDTSLIPDGSGQQYESFLDFNVFGTGDRILSPLDVNKVCLNLEHAVSGQLRIELECPAGNRMMLKDFGEGIANLGEPVIWDPTLPGRGYTYCFVNSAEFGTMNLTTPRFHAYTDRAGNYYFNAPFLPAGTYTPDDFFNTLINCPLNGRWTLRVRDSTPGDNGFIFGWTLHFREAFYPDSLYFSPQIVRQRWFRGAQQLSGNPATLTVNEAGNHTFRFEVTDNFGCSFDTSLVVNVRRLPLAEILSELELPVCQGDSTLLTVVPIGQVHPQWLYQWYRGANPIPDAINQTFMATLPGIYSVRITDTDTGCVNFVEITVTDQNCDLTIPTVFTPNNDGINDKFEILNLEHYSAQIVIFNRWGRRIFEHSEYFNNWWDGANAPDGTYFYVLTYSRGGITRSAEGVITIIR
ncbi:MAG TPA: gliding motility-associated C-terminal domain-containing protein [Bacteroidales bacterium]|nr:gliding motility-associated C-terminal domain-containing protein [Bacteroidales bacterium]